MPTGYTVSPWACADRLWFDTANHQKNFYFGHLIDAMDSLLTSGTPDADISRTPRKISDRVY